LIQLEKSEFKFKKKKLDLFFSPTISICYTDNRLSFEQENLLMMIVIFFHHHESKEENKKTNERTNEQISCD